MKFSAVVLAATSSTLVAAQLDQLAGLVPECATSCLATALGGLTSECGVDIACYCKPENQASIKEKSQPCLEKQCSPEDAKKAVAGGEAICAGGSDSTSSMPMPTGEGTAPGTMESTPSMTMPHTSASMGHSTAMHHNTTMVMPTPTNGGDDSDNDSDGSDGSDATGSAPGSTPTEGAATAPAVGIAAAIMAAVLAL